MCTCKYGSDFDEAHCVFKQHVEDAKEPSTWGEERDGGGDSHRQVHQGPQGDVYLQRATVMQTTSSSQALCEQSTPSTHGRSTTQCTPQKWAACKTSPTSGVKTDSGTMVQKNPRETQCVANLRRPK